MLRIFLMDYLQMGKTVLAIVFCFNFCVFFLNIFGNKPDYFLVQKFVKFRKNAIANKSLPLHYRSNKNNGYKF